MGDPSGDRASASKKRERDDKCGRVIWKVNLLIFFCFLPRLQGKLYVRGDSKIFRFQNGKSESLFLQRKNPRRISWTVLYRRQHRKGISEVRITSLCFPLPNFAH